MTAPAPSPAWNAAYRAIDKMAAQSFRRQQAEGARITTRVDSWPELVATLRRVAEAKSGADFLAVQQDARAMLAKWEATA